MCTGRSLGSGFEQEGYCGPFQRHARCCPGPDGTGDVHQFGAIASSIHAVRADVSVDQELLGRI